MWVKKQQLEPCMEQPIGSKLRKEYDGAVCCHPVCLIYMLSKSREMPGWMSYKLESISVGQTSTTSFMKMIPLYWQKAHLEEVLNASGGCLALEQPCADTPHPR